MNVTGFNESDVREEIAVPVLKALGYAKGTDADILREQDLKLRYGRSFLGRKKPAKDPVLHGRPDYVLRVVGVCRWVLETKPPTDELDIDVIEQAISYARHPEINGDLVAALNGRRFVLYRVTQTANEEPIFSTEDCEPKSPTRQLENILSPHALKRDMRHPSIDPGRSLGGGLRSREAIVGGTLTYDFADYEIIECPLEFEPQFRAQLGQSQPPIIPGSRFSIEGGLIERAAHGWIVASVKWNSPFRQLEQFTAIKGLNDMQYVCIDDEISINLGKPSTFDTFHSFELQEGEEMFDMLHQRTTINGFPGDVEVSGQAVGHIDGRVFFGFFQQEMVMTVHMGLTRIIVAHRAGGDFEIRV
jgi:hypothetical protein